MTCRPCLHSHSHQGFPAHDSFQSPPLPPLPPLPPFPPPKPPLPPFCWRGSPSPLPVTLLAEVLPLRSSYVVSKKTVSPSLRVLKPSLLMAEKWTNTSSLPSSGEINPKPFSALKNFTEPCSDIAEALFGGSRITL